MKYYHEIKRENTESCKCYLYIDWDINQISQIEKASGFIVQHFSRELITKYDIDIPPSTSYYEAWRVANGKNIDKGDPCDDMFTIGNNFQYFYLFQKCAGTSGKYIFKGDVFWIPENHELYNLVDSWNSTTVEGAGGLKAVYSSDEFDRLSPLFARDPFIHQWNLTDNNTVYQTAKKMLFRAYPHESDRNDVEIQINYLLPTKYEHMKKMLITEWNKQWK